MFMLRTPFKTGLTNLALGCLTKAGWGEASCAAMAQRGRFALCSERLTLSLFENRSKLLRLRSGRSLFFAAVGGRISRSQPE